MLSRYRVSPHELPYILVSSQVTFMLYPADEKVSRTFHTSSTTVEIPRQEKSTSAGGEPALQH